MVVFSTTSVPAGLVIAKLPVRNVNVRGEVTGAPVEVTSALPGGSRMPPVSSVTTTTSNGHPAVGEKRAVRLPFRKVKVPGHVQEVAEAVSALT